MVQESKMSENISHLSNEELSEIIANCETAIREGTAAIDDYEAFVLCQKELAHRTWA